jgi:hypothetical protein
MTDSSCRSAASNGLGTWLQYSPSLHGIISCARDAQVCSTMTDYIDFYYKDNYND